MSWENTFPKRWSTNWKNLQPLLLQRRLPGTLASYRANWQRYETTDSCKMRCDMENNVASALHASPTQTSPVMTQDSMRCYVSMDVSTRFGRRLRELRRERNLTQLRMAVDFGIDRSYISDVERGRKSISLPILEVLALGFRLTLSELLRDI